MPSTMGGKLKAILLATASLAVLTGLIAFIIVAGSEPNSPTGEITNEPTENANRPADDGNDQDDPEDDENEDDGEPEDDGETGGDDATVPAPTGRILPDDWDQLTIEQKMEINPYDCPSDSDGVRLDPETGTCLPTEPEEPEPQTPAASEPRQVGINQEFELVIHRHELALTAESFSCSSLPDVLLAAGSGHDLDEILDAFESYGYDYSLVFDDDIWPLIRNMAYALEYLNNFSQHLGETDPAAIKAALDDYKECTLTLAARNAGADSAFSDGCGLDISDQVEAVAPSESRHDAKYIGPGYACTQAEVPFPSNEVVKTVIYFLLPATEEITYLELSGTAPGAGTVRITPGPGAEQTEAGSSFY